MEKSELLYEGKGKKLYKIAGNDENLIAEFKDDLTAFNAQKKSQEEGKGVLNNEISTIIFNEVMKHGIKTHFVEKLNDRDMLVKKVKIIPIEVVVRNVATGSLSKRLGISDGKILPFPLVEFYYKEDALNDPIINDEHAIIMELVEKREELEVLREIARKVNEILLPFFGDKDLRLIDFKLEFGKDSSGEIILADEISPDSCRFWDKNTNEKLDKDRFRQDIGGIKVAYEQVRDRILGK
jgi:phosphoribosylaminoimidazole-succinocarboxamide synthase